MSDWRSYDPNIVGTDGDDRLTGFTYGEEAWPFWAADTIQGRAGDDTIDGSYGADTLSGGAGDDLLTGGAGAVFPGQPDDDLFVYAFEAEPAAYEAFRGGDHPSDRASDRAWEVYGEQAAARGFDTVVGYTEGGRPLYGRALDGEAAYRPLDGHDTLTDFDGEGGDRIQITGIAEDDAADFREHLRFEAGTLYFDDTPLMTLQGVTAFDPGWVVLG